jgi:hypothetical protein
MLLGPRTIGIILVDFGGRQSNRDAMENQTIRTLLNPRAERRNAAPPMLVGTSTRALQRVPLGGGNGGEDWLQRLIDEEPSILPVGRIEPGFGSLISAVREMPCGHGYIDNLLITPQGQIVLVEAKLWSNPQARREVVGQALDYVSALMAMGYSHLEQTVMAKRGDGRSLYDLVEHAPDALDEINFIDALDHNLRAGRMLVLIVGDGITAESERLAELLANRVDAHFTLALVELAVYEVGQERLVVPSVVARTMLIERGVVRLEAAGVVVDRPQQASRASAAAPVRAKTLSDEDFDAVMDARRPGLSAEIRDFAASLSPLGVWADQKRSLNLKVEQGGDRNPINIGYIQRDGRVQTNAVEWFAPPEIAQRYLERLASAIGGTVATSQHHFVSLDGKSAPRIEQILPQHADAWREAIQALAGDVAHEASSATET